MNPTSADSPIKITLSPPDVEKPAAPTDVPPDRSRWPLRHWLLLITLIFTAHVALIFIFGQHQFPSALTVKNVPQLQLADNSSDLIALSDPTLFALPHADDLAFLKIPEAKTPSFRWNEAPRWLSLPAGELGVVFNQFMQTNAFAGYQLNFKPSPKLNMPALSFQPVFAEHSTVRIEGELKQRRLLNEINVPSLPVNDVIPPNRVQVLVDGPGNVISAVLLESSGFGPADQQALQLARTARFAPASHLTVGQIIFNWRTVPLPATNSPANP